MGTIVLLDLMGGVALLLWGLHMVRSGILRAFGSHPARRVALRPRGGDLGRRRGLSLANQNARPSPLSRAMKWAKCAFCKRAAPALTDPHRGAAGPRGDL